MGFKVKPGAIPVYNCRKLRDDLLPRGKRSSKEAIDPARVVELAAAGCTYKEMAAVLGTTDELLVRQFADQLKYGREYGNTSLRRKQQEVAMSGNVPMLQWLGKHRLGQKDDVAEAIAKAPFLETMAALTQAYKVDISDTPEKKKKKLDEME